MSPQPDPVRRRPAPYPVLVVGSGAREHALVWALAQSPSVSEVWAAPGNPGIATLAAIAEIPVTDVEATAEWADVHGIGLVVVGPEGPLAMGLADLLHARGIPVFGPSRAAAELEWSKAFAKDFMRRHGIPTAPYGVFTEMDAALDFIRDARDPLVIKADGLAAGKGVIICGTAAEAESAVRSVLIERAFQGAGDRVVIEGFLEGEELSVIAVVDGERIAILPPARDYKRLRDGNQGPNTGGMGSFAPVGDLDPNLLARVREMVLEPAVAGLRAEGRLYRGALYAGLMLTSGGPMALEFNCRFGDPETQAILPLLDLDLAELLLSCAEGRLASEHIAAHPAAAVCVVLAAHGYPERPRGGDVIEGIEDAWRSGVLVFHAGTALSAGQLVANGGRVLSVVGTGSDLDEATARAYAAADMIQFNGKQMRRDIAMSLAPQPA
ncbi:MAG: phosphoribosylamine--glycine ligase [Chloroflexi bacterium]|nr:phosphoribosylamine--glycine ligase [Chloroflexota bacterium]